MQRVADELEAVKAAIVQTVLRHYPDVQGIYLFGSYGRDDEWPTSDIDIALLLPPQQAKRPKQLALTPCHLELLDRLPRSVDLLNARQVSTVMQIEIIQGRLLYCADRYAVDEFEMLTISYYQKLNEERREILEAFWETGRAYDV